MRTSEIDYHLPPEAIAQSPAEPRDAARLLIDRGEGRAPHHGHIPDLARLVGPGDVVLLNTTRVLAARLHARRPTGGAAELLLLEPLDGDVWEALVRPSARIRPGTPLEVHPGVEVVVDDDLGAGRRLVRARTSDGTGMVELMERWGEVPLPPYITQPLADPDRYQTVYAERPSSAAAPTAGLHLTPGVLAAMEAAGARLATVELAVGIGTFRPVGTTRVADHELHAERYCVPAATMGAVEAAERVVAIGTTSARAIEAAASTGRLEGRTSLFLRRGEPPAVIGALVTNFHQPRSSLLALVDAFVGPRWRSLYEEALRSGYRFLSFGDAMFLRGSAP